MRDIRIYDKYLNMKPKEKKKIDFKVRFDNKNQLIGVIVFGFGLFFLTFGFIYISFRNYNSPAVPVNSGNNVVDNNRFTTIKTPDNRISLDSTNAVYSKDIGLSELNITLKVNEDINELPILIIYYVGKEKVVIADYFTNLHTGDTIDLFKQVDKDLTSVDSWDVKITTKEDLVNNYGFTF